MNDLLSGLKVLFHSAIRIEKDSVVLYFDPYGLKTEPHDADIIFVTHDHFDHFSPEDIRKVAKKDTILVMPDSCSAEVGLQVLHIRAGETTTCGKVSIEAVPAYNPRKAFHPYENGWLGYVVTIDGIRYYVAGDTDINDDVSKVRCDVAFLPVGGTYTMDYREAAELAGIIRPRVAVPTHYGSVAGDIGDGDSFGELLDKNIVFDKCL